MKIDEVRRILTIGAGTMGHQIEKISVTSSTPC